LTRNVDAKCVVCDPVRVVHLVPNLCIGGMERLVLDMLRLSDHRRVMPQVLCIGERGEFAAEARDLGVMVSSLNATIGRNPRLPFLLARFFRAAKTEVVHTHGPYAHFYGTIAAKIAGACRVVHTVHGFPWPPSWRRRIVNQFSGQLTKYLVTVSRDLSGYAKRELGVRSKKLRVIYNGIDSNRFSQSNGKRNDRAAIIMVSRLSSEKDFPTLLHAADAIRRKKPDFLLRLAGDGPQRGNTERLIHELALERHVELLGNRSDIPELLSNAAAFVLSTHTEGISIALLEAMASGLPIVATDAGGNREVVVEGETGFLVPRQSPAMLASRLLWILDHPDESRQMGAAGRRRVEEVFDIRRMVSEYERLYWESTGRTNDDVVRV
jgi:glycosyltransferase involved in cell wall biosynthesis